MRGPVKHGTLCFFTDDIRIGFISEDLGPDVKDMIFILHERGILCLYDMILLKIGKCTETFPEFCGIVAESRLYRIGRSPAK